LPQDRSAVNLALDLAHGGLLRPQFTQPIQYLLGRSIDQLQHKGLE
jgi:hypothetical protein